MKQFKYYGFYQEYIGQKCDYQTFKMRIRNKHSPEVAIYHGRLNEITRGYNLEDKIQEKKDLQAKLKKIKQELYMTKEFKEAKKRLNILSAVISQLRKQNNK